MDHVPVHITEFWPDDPPPTKPDDFDLVGAIMDYEAGELDDRGILELFAHLIETGKLHGRAAHALISTGAITRDGAITDYALDLLDG